MNRKLKALGLALVAVLAMSAFSAATASAQYTTFHSEQAHTIIDGEQPTGTNDVFTVNAGTVTCQNASYSGTTTAATTTSTTVIPTYTGCTAFGFVNATIDVPGGNVAAGPNGGCKYTFTPDAKTTEPPTPPTPQLHILCGAGEVITVTAFNCWVTVGSQTALGISYANEGSGTTRDIRVNANIEGLTYTQHSKSFPGCTNGTFNNGKYVGSGTVKGTDTNKNHVGIWVS